MKRIPANFILPKETFFEGVKENKMCASRRVRLVECEQLLS